MRNATKRNRVVKNAPSHAQDLVLDSSGCNTTDAQLLASAYREAKAWQTRVKAGKTEADRNRPVYTSGCGGTEQPLASLPIQIARAVECEMYGLILDELKE